MKKLSTLILTLLGACFISSCSKSFSCTCYLNDINAGIENGSRVIHMDIKRLNPKKKAEKNCQQYEQDLTTDTQSAVCYLQ